MTPPLRLLTLNLHGFHPMGEAPRWWRHPDGRLERATDHPFFFRQEELERGNRHRLDRLAEHLRHLEPEIVLLQEVAAGDAAMFFEEPDAGDAWDANTALRLIRRCPDYSAALVLRGNRGWITTPETFPSDLVARRGDTIEPVFCAGENPWPHGILQEGFALLVRAPWVIRENRRWEVVCNAHGDTAVCQAAVVEHGGNASPPLIVVNLHAGHKLAHAEQSLAIRHAIVTLAEELDLPLAETPVIVGGDFNSMLYRPGSKYEELQHLSQDQSASQAVDAYLTSHATGPSEPATAFWEVSVPGHFTLTQPQDLERLRNELTRDSCSPSRKPWATVSHHECSTRIPVLLERWRELQHRYDQLHAEVVLNDCIRSALAHHLPGVDPDQVSGASDLPYRIDHLLCSPQLSCTHAAVLFTRAWTDSLHEVSDHPAIGAVVSCLFS